jgi:hypothetical protein
MQYNPQSVIQGLPEKVVVAGSRELPRRVNPPCPFLDTSWRVASLLTWPWIAAVACTDIPHSESRADGDTSGTRDRSPLAHTNKIPIRDRTESCVRARNQRTIQRMPALRPICSARPCNENSIVNRAWLAGRRHAGKLVFASASVAADAIDVAARTVAV